MVHTPSCFTFYSTEQARYGFTTLALSLSSQSLSLSLYMTERLSTEERATIYFSLTYWQEEGVLGRKLNWRISTYKRTHTNTHTCVNLCVLKMLSFPKWNWYLSVTLISLNIRHFSIISDERMMLRILNNRDMNCLLFFFSLNMPLLILFVLTPTFN